MMSILVSGLINLEVTLRVDGFPIAYTPVRYPFNGVNSSVSGVGFNVAKALTVLGDAVRLLALVGGDLPGELARRALLSAEIEDDYVLTRLPATPQSVILYDGQGRRQVNVDLKDVQEQQYPPERFAQALQDCSLAVLCNVNYSRAMLALARKAGKTVATDVHVISDLDDEYNRDFMAAAQILFMSDEHLPAAPADWVRRLWDHYPAEIVVVGLGARGALLGQRSQGSLEFLPAVATRPVVSSIGAGDALFASFLHFFLAGYEPYEALSRANVFASYKIGASGAAEGLLSAQEFEEVYRQLRW